MNDDDALLGVLFLLTDKRLAGNPWRHLPSHDIRRPFGRMERFEAQLTRRIRQGWTLNAAMKATL
jgi:hypothetical protein